MKHLPNDSTEGDVPLPDELQAPKVISLGCRLNGYESEAMRSLGARAGLGDSVIINSCAVTGEAMRQTRKTIRRAIKENPQSRIIVTGCAAQLESEEIAGIDGVDAVIGNHEKLLPKTWRDLHNQAPFQKGAAMDAENVSATGGDASPIVMVNDIMTVRETTPHMIDGYGDRARAFLQIQNGCDHRCTFCIIPYGRGNSRSVAIPKIIEQAQRLVDAGHKELVLTGVDITSYGGDLEGRPTLGHVVEGLLDSVVGLFRLRLSSIDGAEIDDLLFDLITNEERVAPYLHLSLQSGDDMILKRMKRRHTREDAIEFCNRARQRRPDIAFGADIIAGFPTETEEMFQNSCNLVRDAGLNYVHVFPFSAREGTPAARMPQIDPLIIKERAARLRGVAHAASSDFLQGLVGSHHLAIAESGARARLGNFASVHLEEKFEPGAILDVVITGCNEEPRGSYLTADIVSSK